MPAARTNLAHIATRLCSGQTGVGLIEVLIAVVVLSIGFLGIAALQARALANNNSAMMHTQATVASYSILDAMRADRANALAGGYNTTATHGVDGDGKPQCTLSTTLSGLAANQVDQWCKGSDATSLDGLASLGVDSDGNGASAQIQCGNTGVCTVTITFDDRRGSGGSHTQAVITKAML
jgi:type IV pilus assembly protein PilV